METDAQAKILKYLQENKAANTFKLARNLGIDRSKIVRELTKLTEKGLIEHRTGMARFLSMPKPGALRPEEPTPVQKISQPKTQKTESEKTGIRKETPSASAKLARENKKLRAELSEFESHFEQQTGLERRLKAQNTHIGRLEQEIRTLQQKASIAPKVIRKTIVKTIVRRIPKIIVRRLPAKSTQTEKMSTRLSVEAGKPARSSVSGWLSSISQLTVPKVFEQQVELKPVSFDFRKLKENVSRLEIPEILKKGW